MPPKLPDFDDDPTEDSIREGRGTSSKNRGTERHGRVPPKSPMRRKGVRGDRSRSGAKVAQKKRPPSPIELTFDGSWLTVTRSGERKAVARFSATSGLPAGAPHVKELIAKGRKDLDMGIDYRHPRYQSVPDAGPIPDDTYELPLVKNMPFQKTGGGWGVGGWRLESGTARAIRTFAAKSFVTTAPLLALMLSPTIGGASMRGGFFLHHDGGHPGTAGCVGIRSSDDFKKLKQILVDAEAKGQRSAMLQVQYK